MPAAELIDGMKAEDYHAHPALSTSGAKLLLPPSCPAKFHARVETYKPVWDFGKVVHTLVIGEGEEFEVIRSLGRDKVERDADSLDLVSAKASAAEIRAAGKVPILAKDLASAREVADSVKAHQIAAALFTNGKPEQSAFWADPATGVQRRARFDWLPNKVEGRRLIVPDLKTARSAEPHAFGKAVADYGYAMQDDAYREAIRQLGLDPDPVFVFVVVEKEPPYVVTVCRLDEEAREIGAALNRKALRTFADCTESDQWPGYCEGVADVSLPGYYAYKAGEIAQ